MPHSRWLVLLILAAYLSARFRDDMARALDVVAADLTTAAFSVYLRLNGALAFGRGSDATADVTCAVFQLRVVAQTMVSFPAALLVAAVALATHRLHAARPWYPVVSGVVAAVMLASGADVAREGFFAVNGDLSFLGFYVLFPLWAAVSGFALHSQRRPL